MANAKNISKVGLEKPTTNNEKSDKIKIAKNGFRIKKERQAVTKPIIDLKSSCTSTGVPIDPLPSGR